MSIRFLTDVSKLWSKPTNQYDHTDLAVIQEKIIEEIGGVQKVVGYKVGLGMTTASVDCQRFTNAEVGDLVTVLRMSDGSMIVTGRQDGDGAIQTALDTAVDARGVAYDAQDGVIDLATDLYTNYYTADEVDDKISHIVPESSYEILEYAKSSSSTTKPTSGWSKNIPSLDSTNKYLWTRRVKVEGTSETVVAGSESVSTTMAGTFTFLDNAVNTSGTGAGTTIKGNAIYGGTITLGGSNNVNGQLTVKNALGSVTAQLNNNGLYAIAGSIGNFNISSALYSGSHSAVDSKNVGAYVGNNGISYVTTTRISGEKFLVQLGYGSSSSDYSDSIKAIQIAESYNNGSWINKFLLTCDGSLYCDNIEIAPANNEFGLIMYDMDQEYPCKFYVDTIGTLHIKPSWNVFVEDGLSAYDIDCTTFYDSGNATVLGRIYGADNHNLINNTATSGQVHIGNDSEVTRIYGSSVRSAAIRDNTTTSSNNMHVTYGSSSVGAIQRVTSSSSRTIKHDIDELKEESLRAEHLYDLEVVQFKYNDEVLSDKDARYDKLLCGLIIEDLDEKYPICIDREDPKDIKTWEWNVKFLIPPMIKLLQQQHEDIQRLESKINMLMEVA